VNDKIEEMIAEHVRRLNQPGDGESNKPVLRDLARAVLEEAAREAYRCREKVAPIIHITPTQMAEYIMQRIRALKEEKK
jgi:CRISPR/Cas system-associated protein Csm6